MKTDQLFYFLEAARYQHIGKAAKSINISPSAISHSIRNLQEELGCHLFEKVGKNIYLTPHGKLLAERCESLISQIKNIKEEMQAKDVEWQGTYRVAITHGVGEFIFLPQWHRIQKGHSDLRLELYSYRSAQVLELVAKGELDLGICISPLDHPGIEKSILKEEGLFITVRSQHPILKLSASKQLEELSHFPCASAKSFHGIEVCERHPSLAALNVKEKTEFIFDSYFHAISRVRATDSWALLPESFIKDQGLKALIFKGWKAKIHYAAIWPRNRPLPRVLRQTLGIQ